MTDALTRIEPAVRTLARPDPAPLLAARALVQRDADLQVAFVKAKAEGWEAQRLADEMQPKLEATLEGTPEALREAGLYLADEYLQGGDGIMLVSRDTGKVLARLSEEDIWQPEPTRREDGSLVKPLPRIRPDLEGFLVQWAFDRGREQKAVQALAPWAAGTVAARQVTQAGRKSLTQQIEADAPRLLGEARGGARGFLEGFELVEADVVAGTGLVALPRATAYARTRTPLADLGAFNHRFDVLASQKGVIANAWVGEMARMLAESCPATSTVSPLSFWNAETEWPSFWVAPAKAVDLFRRANVSAIFVESTKALGLLGRVGVLQIHPGSYRVGSREVFDRWEVGASVDYTLWVDWANVRGFMLEGLPDQVAVLAL